MAVNVTMKIEDYITKKAVSAIDWNKVGKYRVIYTAIHGNGVVKQTKSIVVTIIEETLGIAGPDIISVPLRTSNCDLNEADLVKGGIVFTSSTTPIVELEDNKGIACILGTYVVNVIAHSTDGQEASRVITVKVVETGGNSSPTGAPGKTIITGNSANPSNVHNTNELWIGGAETGIHVDFKAIPAKGTELAFFEVSKDCNSVDSKAYITSPNQGSMYWTEEGKNKVCIRAVSKDGVAGPWSNIVNLYIDLTGPTVEFTHTWADDIDDWHNTPSLTVTYKATDAGSGLDHFEYTYDDVKAKKADNITTHNEATGKLTVKENTEASRSQLYVYVRAVDKVGNKGQWTLKPAYANMDTVKPNTPVVDKVEGNETKVVKLTVRSRDKESARPSGIGKFIYTMNDENERSQIATALGSKRTLPGETTVTTSRDENGNLVGTVSGNYTSQCPKTGIPAKAKAYEDYTPIEDLCTRSSDYQGIITLPVNNTGSDKIYDVKIWTQDRAGNRSEGYVIQRVTMKSGTAATGVTMKNGDTVIPDGGNCAVDVIPQGKFTLTALPVPTNADEKDATWSIASTTIATIDSSGNVIAKKVGETIITATIGSASTTCKLVVNKIMSCPAGQYLPKGKAECASCLAGSYCEGIENVPVNPSEDKGIKPCPKGYTSDAGAAKCVAKVLKVTYHKNDGSNTTATQTFTYGVTGNKFGYNTDGTPKWPQTGKFGTWTNDSFGLLGWSKSQTATTKTWDVYNTVSDDWIESNYPTIDLYAVWNIPHSSATYYNGGGSGPSSTGPSSGDPGDSNSGTKRWYLTDSAGNILGEYNTHDEAADAALDMHKNGSKEAVAIYDRYIKDTDKKYSDITKMESRTITEKIKNHNNTDEDIVITTRYSEAGSKETEKSITTSEKGSKTVENLTVYDAKGNITSSAVVKDDKNTGKSSSVETTKGTGTNAASTTVITSKSTTVSAGTQNVKTTSTTTSTTTGGKTTTKPAVTTVTYYNASTGAVSKQTASTPKGNTVVITQNKNGSYTTSGSTSSGAKVTSSYKSYTPVSVIKSSSVPIHSQGSRYCFEAGTKVITEKGYKNIEEIKVGDSVLSYNVDTKENEYNKVTRVLIHENIFDDIYRLSINDKVINVTGSHRFYILTNKGFEWKAVKDMNLLDMVMLENGEYRNIKVLGHEYKFDTVYNIEVENNHNYYVTEDGILVHNAK